MPSSGLARGFRTRKDACRPGRGGMTDIYITGAARTPLGAFQGQFSDVTAPQLGSVAIRAALDRAGVDPTTVDEVLMGNVLPAGLGQAPARQAALGGGTERRHALHHGQQGLRVGYEGGDARHGCHPVRQRVHRGCRRDGEHDQRALPAAEGAGRRPHRSRRHARSHDAGRARGCLCPHQYRCPPVDGHLRGGLRDALRL